MKEAHSPPLVQIGQGVQPPFSFLISPSFLLSYSNKGRRSPTPGGSRTPPGAPLLAGRTSPPCSIIYVGRGHPWRHNN